MYFRPLKSACGSCYDDLKATMSFTSFRYAEQFNSKNYGVAKCRLCSAIRERKVLTLAARRQLESRPASTKRDPENPYG